ncbi:ABC transporter C family member 10-like isoform X3 [Senna tora]|uniref:ABC transporter C family member 10-like isoform X3 n=1 Tax=Senna tora TaxID=362788 RepID=A0A834WM35_9FABA|nr:ABC transporter C family member 10-like isoform X3 [Senna tora]
MREAGFVEEALQAKHEVGRKKENNIKLYPPCKHCGKKGHPPYKCWRRPDARCSKCNELGHEDVIYPTNQKLFKAKMKGKSFSLNPLKKEANAALSHQSKVPTKAIKEQMLFKSSTRSKANNMFSHKKETNLTRKEVHQMEKGEEEPSMIKKNKSLELKDKLQKRKVMNNEGSTIEHKTKFVVNNHSTAAGTTLGEISFLSTPKAERTEKKKRRRKIELQQIQATRIEVYNS